MGKVPLVRANLRLEMALSVYMVMCMIMVNEWTINVYDGLCNAGNYGTSSPRIETR
jgi:hypothetical protein